MKLIRTWKNFLILLSLYGKNLLGLGAISLTFDDGYVSHYKTALPLLEKYQLPATFYVSAGLLDHFGYLSTDQLIDLHMKGYEIASHGVDHRNLLLLSTKEVEEQMGLSKEILENLLDYPVLNFAPPYGKYYFGFQKIAQKYYSSIRLTSSGMNSMNFNHIPICKAFLILKTTEISQIKQWVEQANFKGMWIILIYHQIDEEEGIDHLNPQVLEDHLRWIKEQEIEVVSMRQMLESRRKNQCPHQP